MVGARGCEVVDPVLAHGDHRRPGRVAGQPDAADERGAAGTAGGQAAFGRQVLVHVFGLP
jgi:hypothetical protein